jgi:hypothetical protein
MNYKLALLENHLKLVLFLELFLPNYKIIRKFSFYFVLYFITRNDKHLLQNKNKKKKH